jgi:putative aminopeptidase FrvX
MHAALGNLEETISELVSVKGTSGDEGLVADLIAERVESVGLAPRRDRIGNVFVYEGSKQPNVMITAHMDQVGFIVSDTSTDRLCLLAVGDSQVTSETEVELSTPSARWRGLLRKDQAHDYVYLDAPKDLTIRPGQRVAFADGLRVQADGTAEGPGSDNRVGCAILLHAVGRLVSELGVAVVWTVREESGEYAGVLHAARQLKPEALVTVDTTFAQGQPSRPQSPIYIGRGPVLTLMDDGMVGFAPLIRAFGEAAKEARLEWQPEVVRAGVSEAGKVLRVLGVPSLALLVPLDRAHSQRERIKLEDAEHALALLEVGVVRYLADANPL